MKKKELLPEFGKAIFLEMWSDKQPNIGWILKNNDTHLIKHPYVITVDEKLLKLWKENGTDWDDFYYKNKNELKCIHEVLVIKYDGRKYKKFIKNYEKYLKLKRTNIKVYDYNLYCFSHKVISLNMYIFHVTIGIIILFMSKIFRFILNVVILGTIWLFFGNIFKLYRNQYLKYKIREKIKKQESEMPIDSFYYIGEYPVSPEDERLANLNNELKEVENNVDQVSLNVFTLLIAIAGLLLSILNIKK